MGECFHQRISAQEYSKHQQLCSPIINAQKNNSGQEHRKQTASFLKAVMAGPVDIGHVEFPHKWWAGKDGWHDKRHGMLSKNPFNFKRTGDKGKMIEEPFLLFCLATPSCLPTLGVSLYLTMTNDSVPSPESSKSVPEIPNPALNISYFPLTMQKWTTISQNSRRATILWE